MIALAGAHRVEGLVGDAVRRSGIDVPGPMRAWAAETRERMRGQALLEIGETLRVGEALGGLPFKILKGAPLGLQAFGRAGLKRSWDIDVLVEPADAVEAAARVAALGYTPSKPPRMGLRRFLQGPRDPAGTARAQAGNRLPQPCHGHQPQRGVTTQYSIVTISVSE